jgi:hypothetical protein
VQSPSEEVLSSSPVTAPEMPIGILNTITKIELILAMPPRNTNYDSP